MLFTLKKVLGGMMLPLPLLLLLIAFGIALLWFSRFQRTGKLCVSLGWLLLLLLSLQPVADSLLKPIEDKYPTWRGEKRVQYVVVLGGGYTWNPDWAPSSNLINNSLPRLTEGIRLWYENPGSKLIFTGAAAKTNPVSTAEAGARVAESLGIPRSEILVLDKPKDTEEEAAAVKMAIGDAPFLLVTSASHLPRAMIFLSPRRANSPARAGQPAGD
ncbi:membrane Protein [Klebsiella michiganensis]|uniref:Envelope biogenesis factor ElyC n=1 Tax=Klebsiella michiganensis TaxID=1134687 RepID=A0A7H4N2K4_9ENTR|nr:membrane Protein [Klebsiella michiganensis]